MDTRDLRTRWANAFIYAMVTTVMLVCSIFLVAALVNQDQKALAARVDENTIVARHATDAVVCILQLGVSPDSPPRNDANVRLCLIESGYIQPTKE